MSLKDHSSLIEDQTDELKSVTSAKYSELSKRQSYIEEYSKQIQQLSKTIKQREKKLSEYERRISVEKDKIDSQRMHLNFTANFEESSDLLTRLSLLERKSQRININNELMQKESQKLIDRLTLIEQYEFLLNEEMEKIESCIQYPEKYFLAPFREEVKNYSSKLQTINDQIANTRSLISSYCLNQNRFVEANQKITGLQSQILKQKFILPIDKESIIAQTKASRDQQKEWSSKQISLQILSDQLMRQQVAISRAIAKRDSKTSSVQAKILRQKENLHETKQELKKVLISHKKVLSDLSLLERRYFIRSQRCEENLGSTSAMLSEARQQLEEAKYSYFKLITHYDQLCRISESLDSKIERADSAAAMIAKADKIVAKKEKKHAYESEKTNFLREKLMEKLEKLYTRIALAKKIDESLPVYFNEEIRKSSVHVSRDPLRAKCVEIAEVEEQIEKEKEKQIEMKKEIQVIEYAISKEKFGQSNLVVESNYLIRNKQIDLEIDRLKIEKMEKMMKSKKSAICEKKAKIKKRKEEMIKLSASMGAFGEPVLPQDTPEVLALRALLSKLTFETEVWKRTAHRLSAGNLLTTWDNQLTQISYFIP